MVEVTAIAAVAEDGTIATEDGIPWNLPADKRHYKETIAGEPVIMGRRTYSGEAWTDALNIVLSRRGLDQTPSNVTVAGSTEEALTLLDDNGIDHVYNVGGAEAYRSLLPDTNRLILSEVNGTYGGEVKFPDFDRSEWVVTNREPHDGFDIVTYRRVD